MTKNAVLHGRRAALGTAFGVNAGLAVWTVASAVWAASIVRASDTAFTALKLVGTAYLIWLGAQALRAARHGGSTLLWLCTYALVAVNASAMLRRPRVNAAIDRLSGAILIGFGVRLALERR